MLRGSETRRKKNKKQPKNIHYCCCRTAVITGQVDILSTHVILKQPIQQRFNNLMNVRVSSWSESTQCWEKKKFEYSKYQCIGCRAPLGWGREGGCSAKFRLMVGLGSEYLVELHLPCFLCFEVLEAKAHNDAYFPSKYVLRSHFARKHWHPAQFAGLPPALAASAELRTNIHHDSTSHMWNSNFLKYSSQLLIQHEWYKSNDLDLFFWIILNSKESSVIIHMFKSCLLFQYG